ncbi:uncharacterized protein isoform X2 [Notothenia coriiceps]|uniref:Uncharacterized protein isoform X2 n=1 Tax=Notothenia coriiceps TaxID=8208 RepID=A0A6I9PH58_9TELE|nr:PREDICTED: uncharacterized protein LOC104959014 isoform X2 [Notothenia coriiceps]
MDHLKKLEIYIPLEAEVKSIPLSSLPNSVIRRMDLPSDPRPLSDSPEGIWIHPAVIRRKGQKLTSPTGNCENMTSLLGKETRGDPGPFEMSFVSANLTAYRLLRDNMPGESISADTAHAYPLPQGSAPHMYKDAVVIFHGRVYLSSRNHSQKRRRKGKHEPQPASQASIPKNKRRSLQASLEHANIELQGNTSCFIRPQKSQKQQEDVLTNTDNHPTTDKELLHEEKKKSTTCKVTQSKNKKRSDVSSSKTAHSVLQSSAVVHKVDNPSHGYTAADPGPSWLQPAFETQDLGNEESHCLQLDSNAKNMAATEEQSREFDLLAKEEEISLLQAKLRRLSKTGPPLSE